MLKSKSIWRYLVHSKGRHGIHSPFVFDFIDSCLTTKVDKNFLITRKKWFRLTQKDNKPFSVNDLGAGSKTLRTNRTVAQIARNSSSKGLYGLVLYRIAKHYQPRLTLELGTSIGTGSIHLKSGYPSGHLITVEGCEETLRRAYQQFDYWQLDKITPIHSSFDAFLERPPLGLYDLVFIDGNHVGETTRMYIEQLLSQTHNETCFIIDDIRWNDDMWDCWQTLCADERFHVSMDLGRMGLLWPRKEQVKEHFVVRPRIFKTRLF